MDQQIHGSDLLLDQAVHAVFTTVTESFSQYVLGGANFLCEFNSGLGTGGGGGIINLVDMEGWKQLNNSLGWEQSPPHKCH